MRNIKVVDFTYGRRSSDDVNTSLPFTDNYKESKTIQQANAVIASYINENIKDIAEVNSNLDDLVVEVESKQDELISGQNIKTINGETILGSGDISVVSDVSWGNITGDIVDQTDLQTELSGKQDELISGQNIKTINGETILGSGDIPVVYVVSWGNITGDIVDQTDLQTELSGKQDELVSGTNIKTINNESILGEGNIDVQSTITGGATTITGNNLTTNRTLISDSNGKVAVSSVTTTDLTRMKNDSIYSTSEKVIGNWIDGKPVYRKVIQVPNFSNEIVTIATGISNVDVIIRIDGAFYRPDVTKYYSIDNMFMDDWGFNKSNGELILKTNNQYVTYNGYVILEYTKTTD